MKTFLTIIFISSFYFSGDSQINAKLMRYMDVSDSQIVFVYGGDIWLVPKIGGTAIQLTHSPGEESWPRFSPDGKSIAFSASYQGNQDIYVMPVEGGIPNRVTYASHADRMVDWHPDGDKILFASRREMGQRSTRHFFTVDKNGGFPERLSVPYGELGSFSPDGNSLVYITKITENYPFKRYRGGLTSDIIIYDLKKDEADRITESHANDGKPVWLGDNIYFLSDQGDEMRLNLYKYETKSGTSKRLTDFNDFDISHMSGGPNDLVFEMGGDIYLMDLSTEEFSKVEVNVISDLSIEMPKRIDISESLNNMMAAPGGKRIVMEARGELFDVPVKNGYTLNLSNRSGAFDRDPSWSPDGKTIAYWSDQSGEYEIYFYDVATKQESQITQRKGGFGYHLHWSPDSKKITFVDERNDIILLDVESKLLSIADNLEWNLSHPGRLGFNIEWSPDSKWIAYEKGQENANSAIVLYSLEERKTHNLTSGFFSDSSPVFGRKGDYIFFTTDRNFQAIYSDMGDGTWVYPNATHLAAISLRKDVPTLLAEDYDEIELANDEKNEIKSDNKEEAESKGEEEAEKEEDPIKIDFYNAESRIMILPADPGNIGGIMAFEGKIAYLRYPNTGSNDRDAKIVLYDLESKEEEEVISGVRSASLSADGKMILVRAGRSIGLIKPAPGQKIKDPVPTDGLQMNLVPKEEWRQLFNDAWRRHRDFFYDPAMHGLDWDEIRDRYGVLIEDARTRWDVTSIMSNMAAELSAGHTYTRNGDVERVQPVDNGYLGIDWGLKNNAFYIQRIVKPAAWDTEVRSPFDQPGATVEEGDFIHTINGITLDVNKDPYAAFEGLDNQTVVLMISKDGKFENAEKVVVKLLNRFEEGQLRYLEWIEDNRKMVEKLSDGKLGYVYMSNTSGRGQLELVKMYYGQLDKEGFIIDERFNGGGQLADRFLELITKPVVYNLHWRHGKDHTQPIKTNTGPMGMLINGWAGSGGDGLPWAFQELEAGPIVGERTLGILVGPATGHRLIDGGGITVPGARLYDNDGHWFWEGEGVSPDIEVWDDPNILVEGRDPQLERVVKEVMKMVKENPAEMTPVPAPENRTAKGLNNRR